MVGGQRLEVGVRQGAQERVDGGGVGAGPDGQGHRLRVDPLGVRHLCRQEQTAQPRGVRDQVGVRRVPRQRGHGQADTQCHRGDPAL